MVGKKSFKSSYFPLLYLISYDLLLPYPSSRVFTAATLLSGGCAIPIDDYCCGCGTGCLSNLCACPPGYGYFVHLFGTRIENYVKRLITKTRPKIVVISMIYFPDEKSGGSWADGTLLALGYNSNPEKLQLLIEKIFSDATEKIKLDGTRVIALPLFKALDGKNSNDYSARVEPSVQGGHKMANFILDAIFWDSSSSCDMTMTNR